MRSMQPCVLSQCTVPSLTGHLQLAEDHISLRGQLDAPTTMTHRSDGLDLPTEVTRRVDQRTDFENVQLDYVPTAGRVANGLTKPLLRDRFKIFQESIRASSYPLIARQAALTPHCRCNCHRFWRYGHLPSTNFLAPS